jgi:hypothetical protein
MKNAFVFCAWNAKARANYRKTVLNAIPEEQVLSCFPVERHQELRLWQTEAGGFFAWGFGGGQRMLTVWRSLLPGDCILGFFDRHYRVVATLLGKEQSNLFAERIWGDQSGNPAPWENIVFFTKPTEILVPASALTPYFCSTYRGATRIGPQRIRIIIRDFGSLQSFVTKHIRSVSTAQSMRPPHLE